MLESHIPAGRQGERGNLLVFGILTLTLLAALVTAYVGTLQKNSRASRFVRDLGELRHYADTGLNLAIHELNAGTGAGNGLIGTVGWTTADDKGRDGVAGTLDEGEGDGIPTPGEAHVTGSAIGSPSLGAGVIAYTSDTAWP